MTGNNNCRIVFYALRHLMHFESEDLLKDNPRSVGHPIIPDIPMARYKAY